MHVADANRRKTRAIGRVRDRFWFYFWLGKKVARVFLSQSCTVLMQNQVLFNNKVKTAILIIRLTICVNVLKYR